MQYAVVVAPGHESPRDSPPSAKGKAVSKTTHDVSNLPGSSGEAHGAPHRDPGSHVVGNGLSHRAEELLPVMYHELRALARARLRGATGSHTLQPTALVHEAYLRITKGSADSSWNSPGHFFGAAAEAMRQVLVDYARAKGAQKRGGDRDRVCFDDQVPAAEQDRDNVFLVSEVVDALEAEDPVLAAILKLRYFVGLGREEAAAALDIPPRTFDRRWRYIVARIRELSGSELKPETAANAGESKPNR